MAGNGPAPQILGLGVAGGVLHQPHVAQGFRLDLWA
jgi:hypothetical protein